MSTEMKKRRVADEPATEELPVLEEAERAALIRSLREAEADIKAGRSVDYDAETFKDRLVRIYRSEKQ
jgi:hypothetical protein